MQPIYQIKDGLWSNLAAIGFCLSLAGFSIWADYHFHKEVSIFVLCFAGFFVLFCYVFIDSIRHPKSCLLAIDKGFLVWQVLKEGEKSTEERIALSSIRTLLFINLRDRECPKSGNPTYARLVFITRERGSRELPEGFWPGIYKERIVAALKERVPDLKVEERPENK